MAILIVVLLASFGQNILPRLIATSEQEVWVEGDEIHYSPELEQRIHKANQRSITRWQDPDRKLVEYFEKAEKECNTGSDYHVIAGLIGQALFWQRLLFWEKGGKHSDFVEFTRYSICLLQCLTLEEKEQLWEEMKIQFGELAWGDPPLNCEDFD